MSRNRMRMGAAIVALLVIACAPAASSNGQFPIIGSDPDRLVENMGWAEIDAEAVPSPHSFEEPLVLSTSTSTSVEVALKGGGCPPTAQVAVSGELDAVSIAMNLGGAIEPAGVECAEKLTTHILSIQFRQPIVLEGLSVTATRTAGPISEG